VALNTAVVLFHVYISKLYMQSKA